MDLLRSPNWAHPPAQLLSGQVRSCWAPYKLHHPKSARQLVALRESWERGTDTLGCWRLRAGTPSGLTAPVRLLVRPSGSHRGLRPGPRFSLSASLISPFRLSRSTLTAGSLVGTLTSLPAR